MTSIKSLNGRIIADSRGDKTVEVVLELDNGKTVSASVPRGKSRGGFEAQDAEPELAIKTIKSVIAPALVGFDPFNQKEIDRKMIEIDGTPDKSKLGANAILAVSLVCAKGAALAKGLPLWRHLRGLYRDDRDGGDCDSSRGDYRGNGKNMLKHSPNSPRLFANIINGGLHAKNGLPFQEYMVIPKSHNAGQSLAMVRKIYDAVKDILNTAGRLGASSRDVDMTVDAGVNLGDEGGFAPAFADYFEPFKILKQAAEKTGLAGEIEFGLDAAANGVAIAPPELFRAYEKMKNEYGVKYFEDPFPENDFENFASLLGQLNGGQSDGDKFNGGVIIAGDDLTVTNLERMKKTKETGSVNGMIIKPNQIGTVSETLDAIWQARDWNWFVVVSHRSGETMDDFIADLAFAVEADGLKAGAPSQKERLVKYERLAAIEGGEISLINRK